MYMHSHMHAYVHTIYSPFLNMTQERQIIQCPLMTRLPIVFLRQEMGTGQELAPAVIANANLSVLS